MLMREPGGNTSRLRRSICASTSSKLKRDCQPSTFLARLESYTRSMVRGGLHPLRSNSAARSGTLRLITEAASYRKRFAVLHHEAAGRRHNVTLGIRLAIRQSCNVSVGDVARIDATMQPVSVHYVAWLWETPRHAQNPHDKFRTSHFFQSISSLKLRLMIDALGQRGCLRLSMCRNRPKQHTHTGPSCW